MSMHVATKHKKRQNGGRWTQQPITVSTLMQEKLYASI